MQSRVTFIMVALFSCRATMACTLCHTELAEHVRHAVLGHDMWFNIGVSVLPFIILLAVALLIHGPKVIR